MTSEQKQRLLYTSERLNQSGIHLDNTYRIAVETEEIGSQILTDLNHQRETMHKSFNRVRLLFFNTSLFTIICSCIIHIIAQRRECRSWQKHSNDKCHNCTFQTTQNHTFWSHGSILFSFGVCFLPFIPLSFIPIK